MSKRAKRTPTAALQPGGSEPRLKAKHQKKQGPQRRRNAVGAPCRTFQPAVPRGRRKYELFRALRGGRRGASCRWRERAREFPAFFARHDKQDYPARLKRRKSERDARLGLNPNDRCHPGVTLVERLGSRKQRSGVTVLAETKQGHVEQRTLWIERLAPIKALQGCLVQGSGPFGCPGVGWNGVNLRGGNGHMVDQGLAGHAKIAVSMIRRHKPFVAPKKMNLLPIERSAQIREQLVSALRGRAAGKAKPKTFGCTGARGNKRATSEAKASGSSATSTTGGGIMCAPVHLARDHASKTDNTRHRRDDARRPSSETAIAGYNQKPRAGRCAFFITWFIGSMMPPARMTTESCLFGRRRYCC